MSADVDDVAPAVQDQLGGELAGRNHIQSEFVHQGLPFGPREHPIVIGEGQVGQPTLRFGQTADGAGRLVGGAVRIAGVGVKIKGTGRGPGRTTVFHSDSSCSW